MIPGPTIASAFNGPGKLSAPVSEPILFRCRWLFLFRTIVALDGPLLKKLRSPQPRSSPLKGPRFLGLLALLGALMLLLAANPVLAAGRVQEFLPKAQPAEFFPGADRFGPPQGDPPLIPAYQGARLLGYVTPKK